MRFQVLGPFLTSARSIDPVILTSPRDERILALTRYNQLRFVIPSRRRLHRHKNVGDKHRLERQIGKRIGIGSSRLSNVPRSRLRVGHQFFTEARQSVPVNGLLTIALDLTGQAAGRRRLPRGDPDRSVVVALEPQASEAPMRRRGLGVIDGERLLASGSRT